MHHVVVKGIISNIMSGNTLKPYRICLIINTNTIAQVQRMTTLKMAGNLVATSKNIARAKQSLDKATASLVKGIWANLDLATP